MTTVWKSSSVAAKMAAEERGEKLPSSPPPKRTGEGWAVVTMDCVKWLEEQADASLPSIVVSIPDLAELVRLPPPLRITDADKYEAWFRKVAALCFAKVRPDAYVIFFQTDRNLSIGAPPRRISKFGLAFMESHAAGFNILWHKVTTKAMDIVADPMRRPQFSHLFCFSKTLASTVSAPDVMLEGHKGWSNATPDNVVEVILNELPPGEGLVDLFSGEGTVVLAARAKGMSPITCVEIDKERCRGIASRLSKGGII